MLRSSCLNYGGLWVVLVVGVLQGVGLMLVGQWRIEGVVLLWVRWCVWVSVVVVSEVSLVDLFEFSHFLTLLNLGWAPVVVVAHLIEAGLEPGGSAAVVVAVAGAKHDEEDDRSGYCKSNKPFRMHYLFGCDACLVREDSFDFLHGAASEVVPVLFEVLGLLVDVFSGSFDGVTEFLGHSCHSFLY